MVGTSSMAHDILEPLGEDAGVHMAIRFAGLEVGTVGGGTGLPHARAFLSLLRCTGPGSAFRLAQIIAATALCLELSAAASAATPASENFVMAHLANSGRS
jgi:hydroxymethylglutaryl-CoA reductase (NADPH)